MVVSFSDLKLDTPLGCFFEVERQKARERVIDVESTVGTPIKDHTKKMVGLFNRLELLGDPFPNFIAAGILLNSLRLGYKKFKVLYFSKKREKTVSDLINMLHQFELDFINDKQVSLKLKSKKIKIKVWGRIQTKAASSSTPEGEVEPSKRQMKRDHSPSTA
ncbi:uncharacterized protein [Spinacia oleracea]|uniref:Uncharacterized protein n=1 Tax=Spinacia oleracea TaxID=3562 RepID=A0ABM3RIQ2_SPIOL|nr:uncharacterized protein LOC130469964 [Spinacia oleracea]